MVTARRAGVPMFYEWRALYLQPFDQEQIETFIEKSIPFFLLGKRKKARKIVSAISDLAARPMLMALVPELASSNEKVHGLWDLYVFMINKWPERESDWIDPKTLLHLSSKLAVNLVLNRHSRGGERVPLSLDHWLAYMIEPTNEGWKPCPDSVILHLQVALSASYRSNIPTSRK